MISRRAQVGWTTHGHSAVDVNIYASNRKDAAPLLGNHENTAIGDFMRDYLDVDTDAITKQLKAQSVKTGWMGTAVADAKAGNRGDHYQGDFKKRGLGDEACGCGMPH